MITENLPLRSNDGGSRRGAFLFGSEGGPRSRAALVDDFLVAVAYPRGASCHTRCVRVRECVRCVRAFATAAANVLGHGRRNGHLLVTSSSLRYVTLRYTRYEIAANRRGELGAARPPEHQPP